MGSLGPTELIIIGVVLVLLFGATRLPQTAKGLGQALRLFKKEVRDEDKEKSSDQVQEQSAPTPPATPPQVTANGSVQQPAHQEQGTDQGAPAPQTAQQPVKDTQHSSQ